eukprot:6214671-Pleurochrysis_carterae.AAC.2
MSGKSLHEADEEAGGAEDVDAGDYHKGEIEVGSERFIARWQQHAEGAETSEEVAQASSKVDRRVGTAPKRVAHHCDPRGERDACEERDDVAPDGDAVLVWRGWQQRRHEHHQRGQRAHNQRNDRAIGKHFSQKATAEEASPQRI